MKTLDFKVGDYFIEKVRKNVFEVEKFGSYYVKLDSEMFKLLFRPSKKKNTTIDLIKIK